MAFSLGNILKSAANTAAKALSPAYNVASSLLNAGKGLMKSQPQSQAVAQPKTSDALFSQSGNPANGVTTNSSMVQTPVLPSSGLATGSQGVLPRSTTPVSVPSPGLTASGSPAMGPAPIIPPTVPSGTITNPNTNFVPVNPPTGTGTGSTTFTSTPQAGGGTLPGAGGTAGASGPSASGTTPGTGGIPDSLMNGTSDAAILAGQNQITDLSRQLQGKGAALQQAEVQARIPEQQQQLNDVMSQINTLNQDALAEQIKIEGKPIASEFASRQIGAVERMRTVKVLGLSAVASALQGNIALARDYATKSVDARFQPLEAELETLKQQLEFNKDNFTRAEKIRADKLAIALDERKTQLSVEKEKQKQISDIALEAAKNGADADTINAIMSSTDLPTALGAARATLAKKNGVGLYNLSEAQANIASKLADDFEKASGQFSVVRDAYGRIQAAQQGTGISDTALIFSYMKLLDPGSVVREGEFATVANAGSIPQNLLNAYNKAMSGEKLPEGIRKDILSTSGSLYQKNQDTQNNIVNQFNQRAQAYGIPTDLVTRDISAGINGGSGGATGAVPREQIYARLKAKYPTATDAQLKSVTEQFVGNPGRLSELGFNSDLGTSGNGLGGLSAKYESSGSPGAIGYDSTGGYSYGTYQLAHNNAKSFVDQSPYAREFQGLTFNSPQFQRKWKEVAARDPQGFEKAQHDFIQQTHFTPQTTILQNNGIDVSTLSPVLQNVIWSTAVQHGPSTPIVLSALKQVGPTASDEEKIRAIYTARWNNGRNFASSTPAVQKAVYNRFFGPQGEMNLALANAKRGTLTA
jgi:hypothetical protein